MTSYIHQLSADVTGLIYSGYVSFHAIIENVRFTVLPVDGVSAHFFEEALRILIATGAKILFRESTSDRWISK